MKLTLMKIDKVTDLYGHKAIDIPAGGIQFEREGQVLTLSNRLILKVSNQGMFKDTLRYVPFGVYNDESLYTNEYRRESVFSILAHEEVYKQLMSSIKKYKYPPIYVQYDGGY